MKYPSRLLVAVLWGLVAPVQAQEGPADEEAKAVQDLIAGYAKAQEEFMAVARETPPEARAQLAEKRPNATPVIEKSKAFIREHPEHAAIPEVASWLLLFLRNEDRSFVYEALSGHHLSHPRLAEAVISTTYDRSDACQVFLEQVLDKSEVGQARAAAAFVLGYRLRGESEEEAKQRLSYLRMAADGLGDLEVRGRSVKQLAEGQLFAAENLAIGKVAPDIEGEDVHGKPFKLSDYRGKVVVLDFWGHW